MKDYITTRLINIIFIILLIGGTSVTGNPEARPLNTIRQPNIIFLNIIFGCPIVFRGLAHFCSFQAEAEPFLKSLFHDSCVGKLKPGVWWTCAKKTCKGVNPGLCVI